MYAIRRGRPFAFTLLFTMLVVCLGAGALAAAAPANAGPAAAPLAGPPGSPGSLFALLAVQQAQLTASDGAAYDQFGYSVAISGDTAVVGAIHDDAGANPDQGSAYVFTRSGTTWSQQASLTASDGAAGDWFGSSVALSGDTAVVGAVYDNVGAIPGQGSAYVFVRSGTTWSQQAKLTAADGAAYDWFGYSLTIAGDSAVVGARFDDVGANTDQGSAYVFTRFGTTWSQQAQLTAADGAAYDQFGGSVAIAGDTAVVGAASHHVGANADQGSAYVFVRSDNTWSQQAQLTASDGAPADYFGWAVAISGDTVVVGAPDDDVGAHEDQGSAYVFARSGTTWSRQAKLTASDGAAGDYLGQSVAICEDAVVVGGGDDDVGANADQGAAYVFTRSGTTWSRQAKLTAKHGAANDYLGRSVAISGDTAVVGASGDDVGTNTDRGSAYVFALRPARPVAKAPKGLIASRTPTFKWTAAAVAVSYEVRVYRGSQLIRKKTGITTTSWKCTRRLPRGVRLTWKVRGHNTAGAGPWSAKPRFKVR